MDLKGRTVAVTGAARYAIDRLVFRGMQNIETREAAFKSGQTDIILQPTLHFVSTMKSDRRHDVYSPAGFGTEGVYMNLKKPPLDDIRVRRAIAHAMDRDLLNRAVNSIVHLDQKKLTFWRGGYDQFERQRSELVALLVGDRRRRDRVHRSLVLGRSTRTGTHARRDDSRARARGDREAGACGLGSRSKSRSRSRSRSRSSAARGRSK